ncbi:MAG: DUF1761 domain-containing protein [bacterium]|nr:DUF1761 domain-containing protein [bacterium]
MEINYLAVLVCTVLALIIAVVWYGPLFGRKWAEVVGGNFDTTGARGEMQKRVMPLYITQFLLTLFQVTILAFYVEGWKEASGLENALWVWAAFVMPTIASSSMWNNDSAKISWARFLIQSGYQLVVFAMFGFILGVWK